MTRYDPHPQDYDDARSTPHGFTGGPSAAQDASGVPEEGGGLREALEALADEWTYKGEHGWGPWQAGEGPDPEGWVLDHAATTLRAVLAAHPADPEVSERAERLPRLYRDLDGMRLLRDEAVGERDRARHPAAALEADNARLTKELDAWRSGCRRRAWPSHPAVPDATGTAAMLARAQTGEDERLDSILREGAATITALRDGYGVAAAERDGARARVAELEAEVERLRDVEARARRAEDALRELAEAASGLRVAVDIYPERLRPTLRREAEKCRQALDWARGALSDADQTSDTTPSDTTTEEDA